MDKDQKLFVAACKKILRHEYQSYRQEAMQARQEAMDAEPCELKRENKGKQAGNLVLLNAIKEFGITNWRKFMEDGAQVPERVATGEKVAPNKSKGTATGMLDKMLDEVDAGRR